MSTKMLNTAQPTTNIQKSLSTVQVRQNGGLLASRRVVISWNSLRIRKLQMFLLPKSSTKLHGGGPSCNLEVGNAEYGDNV